MTDFVDALAHDLQERRYMKTRRYGRLEQQRRLLEECDDAIERKTLQRSQSIDDQDQDAIDRRQRKTLQRKVDIGLGRIVALYYRPSASYQICERIRCPCF